MSHSTADHPTTLSSGHTAPDPNPEQGDTYFQETETFPLYEDRFPIQILSYLRFSRIQDAALLAKVRLDEDVVITVENEYEVLQLFMADVRDRLQAYIDGSVRCPHSWCLMHCFVF